MVWSLDIGDAVDVVGTVTRGPSGASWLRLEGGVKVVDFAKVVGATRFVGVAIVIEAGTVGCWKTFLGRSSSSGPESR